MANTKVTSRVLANDAVLTANITDANITTAKIADNAVTGDKVADDVALAGNPTTTTQTAGNNTTRIATTAFVTTAVANIVDSAPSALDTLNELAAALGDDANFSTTITNSIATKAPLASPTFTGALTIDDITIDGSTISDSGTFGIDAGGNIELDADGGQIIFVDGGTNIGRLENSSSDFVIKSMADDKDIIFKGEDGGSGITALTLDMSDAGYAYFNRGIDVAAAASRRLRFTDADGTFRAGIQAVDTGGQMIATTAQHDFAIRSQSNLLFSSGGNTERMRIASSSGNVGIGTASPSYPLSVELDASATWLSRFYNTGTTESDNGLLVRTGSEHDGTITLGVYSGSSYKLVVLGDGNVGIGTTSPDSKLDIESNHSQLRLTDSDDSKFVLFSYSGGKLIVRNNSTDTTVNQFTLTEDGKFGIGTIHPDGPLHVKPASGDTYVILEAGQSDGNAGLIYHNNSGTQVGYNLYDTDDNIYYIGVNGINRFKVQSGQHFELRGPDANSNQVKMMDSSGNIDGYIYAEASEIGFLDADGNWAIKNTTDTDIRMFINNSTKFILNSSGNLSITGTLTQNYSDDRLKENKVNIPNATEKLKTLNGFTYTPNAKAQALGFSADRQLGVSAQEVEAVLPEAVHLADAVNAPNGNPSGAEGGGTDYKAVQYEKLIPLLIETIKELEARIKTLEDA